MDNPDPYVFLSHAGADKPFVRMVKARLTARGYGCWLDEHELVPGDVLSREIASAIRRSAACIFVISEHSIRSKWLAFELSAALPLAIEAGIPVFPVRLDDTEVPPELAGRVWADFSKDRGSGWRTLEAGLDRHMSARARPTPDARFTPGLRGSEVFDRVEATLRARRVMEHLAGYASRALDPFLLDALAHTAKLMTDRGLSVDQQNVQFERISELGRQGLVATARELTEGRACLVFGQWETKRAAPGFVSRRAELDKLRAEIEAAIEDVSGLNPTTWDEAFDAAAAWMQVQPRMDNFESKLAI